MHNYSQIPLQEMNALAKPRKKKKKSHTHNQCCLLRRAVMRHLKNWDFSSAGDKGSVQYQGLQIELYTSRLFCFVS